MEHQNILQEFLTNGIGRSKMTSMIYGINMKNKRGIGCTKHKPYAKVQITKTPTFMIVFK